MSFNIKMADIPKKSIQRWAYLGLIAGSLVTILVLHPWNTSPGPGELIAKASAATMELQSYRMTGSTMTTFEEGTSKTTFEMEFVSPDRYHGKITINEELYEYIIIGDKQYSRELGSDQSVHIVAIVGYSSTPTVEQTLEFLRLLNDLEQLPDEKIEGIDCLHFKGEVNMDRMVEEQIARLDPAQPGYEEWVKSLEQQLLNIKMELELWIDKDDYLIRQLKQDMHVPPKASEQTEWVTFSVVEKYYDFNEPIAIESPETASGELAAGWRLMDSSSPGFEFEEPPYPSKTPVPANKVD